MTLQEQQIRLCEACKESTQSNSCIATILVSMLFFVIGLTLGAIFL
jgi:hypothetical protein